MPFWNKDKNTQPQAPVPPPVRPASPPPAQRVALRNPGQSDANPRQQLYGLFHSGMAVVCYAPVPVEQLLAQLNGIVPVLRYSRGMGKGLFLQFTNEAGIWAAVDGPQGSAVAALAADQSQFEWYLDNIVAATNTLPAPLRRDLAGQGEMEESLARLVEAADVVPVWETPEFRHLDPGLGFLALPASIRRAARGWRPHESHAFYTKDFRDSDGDDVTPILGIDSDLFDEGALNRPALLYGLGPFPPDRPLDVFAGLTARGPYRVARMVADEPRIVLVRDVPLGIDAQALDAAAQTMVDDYAAFNRGIRARKNPPLPDRDTRPLWARVEGCPAGARASCPVAWPNSEVPYTVVERVRYNTDEDPRPFDTLNEDAKSLIAARGTGFEYALRGADDRPLLGAPLQVKSFSLDPETGRFVACGFPAARLWDQPPAFDLGAIDGSNWAAFPDQGHPGGLGFPSDWVFVGSTKTGALGILDAGANGVTVNLHGPSGRVAAVLFLGGAQGAAVVYDEDGGRRVLTQFERVSGSEPIRFSGDGTWLLVSMWNRSVLIEVATGRSLEVPVGNATWWPLADSTLLAICHEEGAIIPRLFNLEANAWSAPFPAVSLDVDLLPGSPYLWGPSVSPDGRQVVAHGLTGVTAEHRDKYGTGDRLVEITLADGHGTAPYGPFLNEAATGVRFEREVREARWTARQPARAVRLHPALAAQVTDPVTDPEGLSLKRGDGEQVLILSLNTAVERVQADFEADIAPWLPFMTAALVSMAADPEAWARQGAWLHGARDATLNAILDGVTTGRAQKEWELFASAVQAGEQSRPDLIDALSAIYV